MKRVGGILFLMAGLATLAPQARLAAQDDAGAPPAPADPAARVYPIDPETAPRPVGRAARAAGPIVVDGMPDEAAWRAAEPLGEFVQQEPATGAAATWPTVVRVLYDERTLYIAAVCYDPEPHRAITAGLEHDFNSGASDIFGVVLDTFLDRRNSFLFLVNPGGAVRDEQTFDDSRSVVPAWDGVVDVRTAASDSAWFVEMAIPLTTLRFDADAGAGEWGINFIRRIRRLDETSYWAPLERRDRIHKMSKAGTLTGLTGLRQGRNLTLKPYALAGRATGLDVDPGDRGTRWDAGADLKYGLTPSLTLDLTLNTDFAQTEVDREQVNLTRFSVFFPEQREFFIENAGAFAFGDVSERNYRMGASLRDLSLFHSRRIGLLDGRPIPIRGGGRLTGRVGGWELGVLDMQTAAADAAPAENFAVARVRRRLGGASDIGAILINRQATGAGPDSAGADGWNRSYGADANLRLGGLVVNGYLAGVSDRPATSTGASAPTVGPATSHDWAGRVSVAFRDRLWNTSAMVKRVGDAFDPGVGFVRRRDMIQSYGTVGLHTRPGVPWLRELAPYVAADYVTGLDHGLQTRSLEAGVELDLLDGGALEVAGTAQTERIEEPFDIGEVVVEAGRYDFREARVSYRASSRRKLSGRVSLSGGEFWSGTRRSVDLTLAWRPRHDLFLEGLLERNDLDLPGGAATADVAGARVQYAFSTRLFGGAFVQRNAATDQTVANLRLDWRHAPLSDLFLVFTWRHDPLGTRERTLALKATRLVAW